MLYFPKMLLAAVLALPLLLFAAVRAEDWPQWRGLNRDGVCDETDLLQLFPAAGLKVRWRVPVGWGFSSPVVAQGRVFLAEGDLLILFIGGKPGAGVVALHKDTGKEVRKALEAKVANNSFQNRKEL